MKSDRPGSPVTIVGAASGKTSTGAPTDGGKTNIRCVSHEMRAYIKDQFEYTT